MLAYEALNMGLLQNYAGGVRPARLNIFGLEAKTVAMDLPGGWHYTDQWFGKLAGGGRELAVRNGTIGYIRLYAGGTHLPTVADLGLNESQVIEFLIKSIQARPDTRLNQKMVFTADPWSYLYQPTDFVKELDLVTGRETISNSGRVVFTHCFHISPIK